MINPDVGGGRQEIVSNVSNGNAYWMFRPAVPNSFSEQATNMAGYGDFLEVHDVVAMAAGNGSVLVQGAPGSGKSHLVRELQTAAVVHNVPTFCLTTHINAGKREGIDNLEEPLGQFIDAVGDSQGLVILDNVDFLGYKGSSRRANPTAEYAAKADALFGQLIDNPNLVVVGTAHDDAWRAERWSWDDPRIDTPARQALERFGSHLVFEGRMSLVGLAHILHGRGGSLGGSARVMRELHKAGRANFFHANHLDPLLYLQDPNAAIRAIEIGRQQRIKRT